jgi:hypothetical protein
LKNYSANWAKVKNKKTKDNNENKKLPKKRLKKSEKEG